MVPSFQILHECDPVTYLSLLPQTTKVVNVPESKQTRQLHEMVTDTHWDLYSLLADDTIEYSHE